MPQLTSTIKGVITGIVLVLFLIFYYYKFSSGTSSPIMYIEPLLFGLGIVWAIFGYNQSAGETQKFNKLFQQGFKCFVVATLMVTLYYIVFYKMHPELIEQNAVATKEYMLKNDKSKTPQEIDQLIASGKKNFITVIASMTMFQHLIIGAIVSAATAGILSLQKKF